MGWCRKKKILDAVNRGNMYLPAAALAKALNEAGPLYMNLVDKDGNLIMQDGPLAQLFPGANIVLRIDDQHKLNY